MISPSLWCLQRGASRARLCRGVLKRFYPGKIVWRLVMLVMVVVMVVMVVVVVVVVVVVAIRAVSECLH